jgi:hypothetical protein
MKVKTSEANYRVLNYLVAKYEFPEPDYEPDDWMVYITEGCSDGEWVFKPSTDWQQGGPIIEREWLRCYPVAERIGRRLAVAMQTARQH